MNKLDAIRYAGFTNTGAISHGFEQAKPGVSLLQINNAIETYILISGCTPIFKGYKGFPGAVCLCPNEVVVHGVPSEYVLKNGDLLTIDLGCSYEGWMVDSARTRTIGDHTVGESLIYASEAILQAQINILKPGISLLDILKAAENKANALKVNIFHQFGGHQIGRELHMEPFIPNAIDPSLSRIKRWELEREYDKFKLEEGQIICLEPVTTFGKTDIIVDDDGWTVRSKDGSFVAHSESCILIKENGYEIIS